MKRILSICLVVLLLATIIPAVSLASTQYGYVIGGWLRLRSGPSFSYSTITSYYTGTRVEILGTSGSWYHVEAPDGQTGYMYSSYISLYSPGTGTAYVTSTNGYGVRMRSGPSTGYRILAVYPVGTAVTILDEGTYWDKIQVGTRVGYMMNKFLTTSGGGTPSGDTASIWSPNGYGVRLRTGPSTSYSIIGVYSVGTVVSVLSHGSTWDYITVGSRTGYMMNYYLTNYIYDDAEATSIAISPATTSAAQGDTVDLTTTVDGTNLSSPAYTLAITQNASMASLSGDTLTINGSATIGAVIIVTATSVDENSSGDQITATCEVTVTASDPLATSITIDPSTDDIKQGTDVTFVVTVDGVNLSSPAYTLSITQGSSLCTLVGDTLTVDAAATIGSVIKVTALSVDNNSYGNKIAVISELTVIAATVPDVPTLNTAIAGNGEVALTWTEPASDGGSPILGYYLYYNTMDDFSSASVSTISGTSSVMTSTISGLSNDTPYYFWVAAVNAIGLGAHTDSLSATPTATASANAPTDITLSADTIDENSASGTTVGTFTATDADVGDTFTYALVSGTGDTDNASFTIDADALKTAMVPDYETQSSYSIRVQVTDSTSNTYTEVFTITINDVNEAPSITSGASSSCNENQTSTGYTATATDPDGDTLSYSISGTDSALFTIDSSSGVLTFLSAPDYETPGDTGADNVYDLTVTASDGTLSDSLAIAITVNDLGESAPVFTSGSTASCDENQTSTGYTAAATDADGDPITYSISGTDSALFAINSSSGVLSFASAPNYESPADSGADNTYDITVTASDGVLSDSIALAITVNDVNEAPSITSGTSSSCDENQTSTGYTASATDPDGDTLTYSISGTDSALFTIDSSSGVLSFLAAPDYETPGDAGANNVYDLTVTASDGTLDDSLAITITVNDVTEP